MELYWYCIKDMDEETYRAAYAQLEPVRRKHIDGLAVEDDRKRSVAAELLARRALAEKLGCDSARVPIKHDEDDKPYLESGEWYVSLSHSGQYAVCAVGEKPLGVDVEVIRTAEEKFMRRVCSEREFDYVRPYEEGGFLRFWECWTAKEALFKLTGKGPLLKLSRYELPEDVALDYAVKNGCAVTVAMKL